MNWIGASDASKRGKIRAKRNRAEQDGANAGVAGDAGEWPMKYPLLAIVGPTASGKSDVALHIAQELGGEIISADSMQVYRYFDIGTAKPSKEEQSLVRHHLIDIVEPDETYNAAQFAADVSRIVPEIVSRGHLPILAGGTGLYVRAAVSGFLFPSPGRDEQYRRTLELEAEIHGNEYLWEQLQKVDPVSAARIHTNDRVRIIRALEVYQQSGLPVSQHAERHTKNSDRYNCLMVCLNRDRAELYERINLRTEKMLAAGWVSETQSLVAKGYDINKGPLAALGYAEIVNYLYGKSTWEETVELIKRNTRRFAKRQLTWFRREEDAIWIDLTDRSTAEVSAQISTMLEGRSIRSGE
jgi:tRNA dimethylallyltransferase